MAGPGQNRKQAIKSDQHAKNINRRGHLSAAKQERKYKVGPFMLGIFVFVVIGSAVVQIISSAQKGEYQG